MEENKNFKNIQAVKSGFLITRCDNARKKNKLKQLALNKFSDKYDDAELVNCLTKPNKSLFTNNFKCLIIDISLLKEKQIVSINDSSGLNTHEKLIQTRKNQFIITVAESTTWPNTALKMILLVKTAPVIMYVRTAQRTKQASSASLAFVIILLPKESIKPIMVSGNNNVYLI